MRDGPQDRLARRYARQPPPAPEGTKPFTRSRTQPQLIGNAQPRPRRGVGNLSERLQIPTMQPGRNFPRND